MVCFKRGRRRSAVSAGARGVIRGLRGRGVVLIRGAVFTAMDPSVGQPPEGAAVSKFVMHRDAKPLSEAEQSLAETVVRGEVAKAAGMVVAEADTTVSMAVASFTVRPGYGIHLVVELHGLVDRKVSLSLN
jgi:hypothetical protein